MSTYNDLQQILPNLTDIISNPTNNPSLSFIVNYVTSIRIINYKNTYDEVSALTLILTQSTLTTNTSNKLQSLFASSNLQQQYLQFIQTIQNDKYALAAFLSSATPEGSQALLTTPKTKSLQLTSLEFKTIINLRLRANITEIPNMRCSCSGNSEIDNKGDHLSKCRKGKEIFATHDAVKQEIVAFCRSNGLYARAEPNNMFRIQDPDDNKRPDIEVRGLPTNLLLDVTVVSPLYSDLSIPQSKIQGRAAARTVIVKNNKYQAAATSAGYSFIPIAFENRGLWSKETKDFFNLVIKHGSQQNYIKPAILKCYWMRRISLTLLKFSARSILKKQSRIQSPNNYHDESNYLDVIHSQSTLFPHSIRFSSFQIF